MEFISLGPEDGQEDEGTLQTTEARTTVQDATTKASSSEDIVIDLEEEEGQFASDTQAVDVINGLEPLAFQHQPQDRPPTAIFDTSTNKALLQTEAPGVTAAPQFASQHQPQDTMDSTNKASSSSPHDFIDLEEGQFLSQPEQTQAVDAINGVDPLASQHQPQDSPSTKASVDFIDLEQGQVACEADAEVAQLQAQALVVSGVAPLASSEHQPEDIPSATDGTTQDSHGIIDLEEGQVEDMDLSDDDVVVVKHQPPHAPVQAQASVPAALQTIHGVSVVIDKGDNAPGTVTPVHASRTAFIDESRILSNE